MPTPATSSGTNNPDRPNMAPGRTLKDVYLRTPEHWVDATAFALPPAGTYGPECSDGRAAEDCRCFAVQNHARDRRIDLAVSRAEAFNESC